jgi:hypothetical protein
MVFILYPLSIFLWAISPQIPVRHVGAEPLVQVLRIKGAEANRMKKNYCWQSIVWHVEYATMTLTQFSLGCVARQIN